MLLIFLILTTALNQRVDGTPFTGGQKCQEITVPMCRNIEYNMTSFPNQFNHGDQQEAAIEVHQFWALVEINCAKDLKFFLCSMYTPICLPNYPQSIKACRSVCLRTRDGCEKYMKKFGFEWPDHMNCDLFPEHASSKEVCMDPVDANQQKINQKLKINHKIKSFRSESGIKGNAYVINRPYNVQSESDNKMEAVVHSTTCPVPFIFLTDVTDKRFDKYSTGNVANCLQPCHSMYFTQSQQQFAITWLMIWSIICFVCSLFTYLTFLIEPKRFKYPERPIVYLSVCYLFISFGYLLRFIIGHEKMACDLDGSIKYNSTQTYCTLSFMLIYFFGMASSIWWCIISLTWFLAAGLKWSTESIAKYGVYFHCVAWLIPFVKTLAILSKSLVDPDSLSGVCYVGNLNVENLKLFVLVPSIVYLTIGLTFLVFGFVSLFNLRNSIIIDDLKKLEANKLEKLMIRIGIFSILYTVPCTCVIACQFYEYFYKPKWEKIMMTNCKHGKCLLRDQKQSFEWEFFIYLLKYFMSLIAGITVCFWVLTSKTIQSWLRLFGYGKNNTRRDTVIDHKPIEAFDQGKLSYKDNLNTYQSNELIYKQIPLAKNTSNVVIQTYEPHRMNYECAPSASTLSGSNYAYSSSKYSVS